MKSGRMGKGNVAVNVGEDMLLALCLETVKERDRVEDIGIGEYNIKIGL
jgi:hypothetical protein